MSRSQNAILASLPADEYERLAPHLELRPIKIGDVLLEAGEQVDYVYFPIEGIISLVATTPEGGTIEIAPIGVEGAAGLGVLTSSQPSVWRFLVQATGQAFALPVDEFHRQSLQNPTFLAATVRYVGSLLELVSQATVCNRFHELHQRLAFWLLCMHDRVGRDIISVTQDIVAEMLGVHRPSVTVAMQVLQQAGAIERTRRGQILVSDRDALIATACDCYSAVGEPAVVRATIQEALDLLDQGEHSSGEAAGPTLIQ